MNKASCPQVTVSGYTLVSVGDRLVVRHLDGRIATRCTAQLTNEIFALIAYLASGKRFGKPLSTRGREATVQIDDPQPFGHSVRMTLQDGIDCRLNGSEFRTIRGHFEQHHGRQEFNAKLSIYYPTVFW